MKFWIGFYTATTALTGKAEKARFEGICWQHRDRHHQVQQIHPGCLVIVRFCRANPTEEHFKGGFQFAVSHFGHNLKADWCNGKHSMNCGKIYRNEHRPPVYGRQRQKCPDMARRILKNVWESVDWSKSANPIIWTPWCWAGKQRCWNH